MLKNIYTDIQNVEDYVNNLIKPRSVSLEIQKTNFCDDKYNSKDMFYIARTPIFTENAEQELLNEQKKLNQASLTKNSSQKELVQYAISILCDKYAKLAATIKRNNSIGSSSNGNNNNNNKKKNNSHDQQHVNFHNVLSLGYGAPTGYNISGTSSIVGAPAIANFYPNTLVNILQTNFWEEILNKIGDELMLHMLLNCSIFKSLENGCFMQITGPALSDVSNELHRRKVLSNKIVYVPRMSMFYSQTFPSKPGLSKYHFIGPPKRIDIMIANSSLASKTKAMDIIFKHILKQSGAKNRMKNKYNSKKSGAKIRRLPKSYLKLVLPIQQIMENHATCEYNRLINKHCPLIKFKEKGNNLPPKEPGMKDMTIHELELKLGMLTQLNTPTTNVVHYIWNVLHCLLSPSFFGSKHNENVFRSNLKYFLQCGRHDVVRLDRLIMSIKTTHMPWLASSSSSPSLVTRDNNNSRFMPEHHEPPSTNEMCLTLLQKFVQYIYIEIVIPILRHDFYITEMESSFNKVGYYRRSVWNQIQSIAIEKLKRQKLLRSDNSTFMNVDVENTNGMIHTGSSRKKENPEVILRFVPKKRTVRPIMNMSRKRKKSKNNVGSSSSSTSRGLSKNQLLKNTYKALKYETERNPSLLGAAVYGHDDIYKKLRPFLVKNKGEKLYFVALDIMTCYDSISQQKCFDIVQNILKETEYVFQRYSVVHPEPADQSTRVTYIQEANTLGNEKQFLQLSNELSKSKRSAVFTDSVIYRNEEKEKLIEILKDHVFNNLVNVAPGQSYLQTNGIPQGSILSTLMCNLYYGKMERMKFPQIFTSANHLEKNKNVKKGKTSHSHLLLPPSSSSSSLSSDIASPSIMVRLIDDYLLVTKEKTIAEYFVRTMHTGVPEFACNVKSSKTKINFNCKLKENDFTRIEEGGNLTWCGLLINTTTGEIKGDYSKYENVKMKDVVTNVTTGEELSKKIRAFLKPKCHALLFDIVLNGIKTVRINAFHMYLVAAIKYHSLIQRLPQQPNKNPDFFYHVVVDSCKYGNWLINDRCNKFNTKSNMNENEIIYIGLSAFFYVLKRKQSRYRFLMSKMERQVAFYRNKLVIDLVDMKSLDDILVVEKYSAFLKKLKW